MQEWGGTFFPIFLNFSQIFPKSPQFFHEISPKRSNFPEKFPFFDNKTGGVGKVYGRVSRFERLLVSSF